MTELEGSIMDTTIPQDDSARNLTPKTTFIYVLIDPRDNEVRYVGKSNNPPQRLKEHLRQSKTTYKGRWIAKLQECGLIPLMKIIEEVSFETWPERECYWIAYYRAQGCALTNTTEGGKGASTLSPEIRAKIAAKNRGRKLSPEQIERLAAGHRGKKRSPEAVAKLVASKRGAKRAPFSDEWKHNLSESKRGKIPSEETRAKLSASLKGKKHPPLSEEHKRRIIEANTGRERSIESKAKTSAALRGKKRGPHTEEWKQQMSERFKGRKNSPESVAKMLETRKRNRAMRENPPDVS